MWRVKAPLTTRWLDRQAEVGTQALGLATQRGVGTQAGSSGVEGLPNPSQVHESIPGNWRNAICTCACILCACALCVLHDCVAQDAAASVCHPHSDLLQASGVCKQHVSSKIAQVCCVCDKFSSRACQYVCAIASYPSHQNVSGLVPLQARSLKETCCGGRGRRPVSKLSGRRGHDNVHLLNNRTPYSCQKLLGSHA